MTSDPVDAVVSRIKKVYGTWGRNTTVTQMRADWDTLFQRDLPAAVIEPVTVPTQAGDLRAQWISGTDARVDKAIVYFHGGGFQVGSVESHRELMYGIAVASGCRVLGVDYRLAPEHRFPAALHDAPAVYDWLIAQGFKAHELAFAGDSAGGGLVLSMLLSLRDSGRSLPGAAALLSPWTDLTASGESYRTRADADPIHQRPMIVAMARNYLGADHPPDDPQVSPLFAELGGLPPLLIHGGDRETVLSDSTEFASKARNAGVDLSLQVWPGMIHVFQQFPAELSEAGEAIKAIGDFFTRHLDLRKEESTRA